MTQAVVAETWHRVGLEGTKWSVWRDVGLRGAGFSADTVLAICDSPLASSADRDGRGPVYDAVFADAAMRLSTAIAAVNADPAFQEALTWQNPGLVQFLHDHDISQGAARRSKDRKRELVVASYLQRYCLKNDTIGFFGPVGWATAGHDGPGLAVMPGERLISRRTTHFEVWAIDKVAAAIARQGRVLGWLRPRRTRSVFLAGNVLHRPHRPPVTLTDAELKVLLACDGRRTISDVLESVGPPRARGLLTRLAELGALRLDLEGPMDAWPERLLRETLEQIADPGARAAGSAICSSVSRSNRSGHASIGPSRSSRSAPSSASRVSRPRARGGPTLSSTSLIVRRPSQASRTFSSASVRVTGGRCGRCSTFPARNTDRVRRGRSQPRTRPCRAISAASLSIAHTSKCVVRRAISRSPGITARPGRS